MQTTQAEFSQLTEEEYSCFTLHHSALSKAIADSLTDLVILCKAVNVPKTLKMGAIRFQTTVSSYAFQRLQGHSLPVDFYAEVLKTGPVYTPGTWK